MTKFEQATEAITDAVIWTITGPLLWAGVFLIATAAFAITLIGISEAWTWLQR